MADPAATGWGWWRERRLPGIVTTAASTLRAPRDMTEPLLRVSPHVDCTAEDLDRLRQALIALD
jgi:hercynylcysteine S-oxide lyase